MFSNPMAQNIFICAMFFLVGMGVASLFDNRKR